MRMSCRSSGGSGIGSIGMVGVGVVEGGFVAHLSVFLQNGREHGSHILVT